MDAKILAELLAAAKELDAAKTAADSLYDGWIEARSTIILTERALAAIPIPISVMG